MANLHEDVLRNIFEYLETPLDWIPVSEVCQLWKRAASKQWNKINEIDYRSYNCYEKVNMDYYDQDKIPIISEKDAKRIVRCAAPFVKALIAGECISKKEQEVLFGRFLYKVKGFDPNATLLLLAKNAKNITEIQIYDTPKKLTPLSKLFQLLINANRVKRINFKTYDNFYNNFPTEGIEELQVRFSSRAIPTFEGLFPDLKKLRLEVRSYFPTKPEKMLSLILPFVLKLTSFCLYLMSDTIHPYDLAPCSILMDIARFSELENLTLVLRRIEITDVNHFLKKLVNGCPKLREVQFHTVNRTFSEKQLSILSTLPRLESLDIQPVWSFQSVELPELTNLSKLKMEYEWRNFDVTSFCDNFKKMPKLKNLEMTTVETYANEHERYYRESRFNHSILELVCKVATEAASQSKEIVVWDKNNGKVVPKWKIARQKATTSDMGIHTLKLKVSFASDLRYVEKDILERLKTFVQNDLKGYHVVTM